MNDLSHYRKSYEKNELLENNTPNNPFELFKAWFKEAENSNTVEEVNAMTVSTIGLDGYPKSRVVLLKQFDEKGFVFFTNYESEKGKAIDKNPKICLSFFWQSLERQIIIKGEVNKISAESSDAYFNSRPAGSRLGAIVSNQSAIISNREFLEKKLIELEKSFKNKHIQRPENWGGYLVNPIEIEFWQGRPNRLHDRIRFLCQADKTWKKDRLSP
jgi:pyridoxamine 5'-phosphate oxidase